MKQMQPDLRTGAWWAALSIIVLAVVAMLALTGCARAQGNLDGTRWKLDVWIISSVGPHDVPITARFAAGRITGSVGAATYDGSYTEGPGAAFSTGPVSVAQAAESDTAVRARNAYVALLGQTRSFRMTDGRLALMDEFGNPTVTFIATKD